METCSQSSSQQILWKDIEAVKEKKAKHHIYQRVALSLVLVFLVLALSVFSLRYLWSPSLGKVYDHQYKAVLDGIETDSVLEIDPGQRVEIFRMGNGSEEVIEVHDFKNGITGIRFAEHQRCYIRTQTRKLPTVAEVEAEDTELLVSRLKHEYKRVAVTDRACDDRPVKLNLGFISAEVDMQVNEAEVVDMKVEDSHVWVLEEEPIVNPDFLLDSKIWEICQNLPIHWIHPSPLSDVEMENVDAPDAEVTGRFARDVLDHPAVNDYREVGFELENHLDDNGYCCQHCRRGYRFCRRYFEPLGGFNPWPYYYQGGRVVCQIVMPCNWWIARMLGRV